STVQLNTKEEAPMTCKFSICSNRMRSISERYSWSDHRLARDGLTSEALIAGVARGRVANVFSSMPLKMIFKQIEGATP
ncbi:MAG: hypothetical protein U1D97_03370, partial [Desulfuromonadales bacterium]|nr:hypothetical protein [Desulfuromonadales bacterium]